MQWKSLTATDFAAAARDTGVCVLALMARAPAQPAEPLKRMSHLPGKAICKRDLQQRFLLDVNPDVSVIGVVSRLVSQKGFDLLAQTIERIVDTMLVQFVILTGSPEPVVATLTSGGSENPGGFVLRTTASV